ncbi:MAG: hypothetical protein WCG97_03875 [bacterium]
MKKLRIILNSIALVIVCFIAMGANTARAIPAPLYMINGGVLDDAGSWYEDAGFNTAHGAVPTPSETGIIQSGISASQSNSVTVDYHWKFKVGVVFK